MTHHVSSCCFRRTYLSVRSYPLTRPSNPLTLPLLIPASCSYSSPSSTSTSLPPTLSSSHSTLPGHTAPSPPSVDSLTTTHSPNPIASPSAIPPQPVNPSSLPLPIHPMTTGLKTGITKPKTIFTFQTAIEIEPTSFNQAMKHPHWHHEMSNEFLALQQHDTWQLVPPPPEHNILGCRWTFRLKRHVDSSIAQYKACLVAQGFTQESGVDYHETSSPIARIATIRLFLTVAATHSWDVLQFDISNAFLHGHLDEVLYMAQPPKAVPRLHMPSQQGSLYLKQAPRLWYSTFSAYLRHHGFQVSTADPSLLIYQKASIHANLLLYVDDFPIAGNTPGFITVLTTHLHTKFNLKSLGPITTFSRH